jgi:hypothetical protein
MLEAIFELIFGFVGELVLELVLEVLVELGFHGTAERISSRARSRLFVGAAYTVFGAVLGFASLYVFPKIAFASVLLPLLYFVLSTIFAGLSLTTVSYFINRGIRPASWFEWDKFLFGVLFAVAYSVARVIFG